MKLEGMVQLFCENLHQLEKIPARLDGIRKQDCYPPDDRPVSYTHLDVYKRQTLVSTPSSRFWISRTASSVGTGMMSIDSIRFLINNIGHISR